MLRSEAIELQTDIEKSIENLLEITYDKVTVQLSLSNKFKVCIDDLELLYNRNNFDLVCFRNCSYIDFDVFNVLKNTIQAYLIKNSEKIKLLIWSYDNQSKLID